MLKHRKYFRTLGQYVWVLTEGKHTSEHCGSEVNPEDGLGEW